jgi:hypothetical protein
VAKCSATDQHGRDTEKDKKEGKMNRRKYSRRVYLGNVLVSPLRIGRRFFANALNISQGGLELFCRDFLDQGSSVELQMLDASPPRQKMLGKVTNVRVDVEGNVLGISFASPLTAEEKEALFKELKVRNST